MAVVDAGSAVSQKRANGKKMPPPVVMLAGLTLGLGAILILLLMVFILPSLKSGAHDLRVGIVGAPTAVTSFEKGLAAAAPDAYEPRHFDSETSLKNAIEDREVVGGFVVGEAGVHTLVAGAGSASISGSLTGTAQTLGLAMGEKVTVEDVVPLPESDPTGIGIGGLAFPLVFGGIVPVVAFRKIFPRSNGWYLTGLVTFSVVGGLVVACMLAFGFGSIEAGLWSAAFWSVAGSIALGIAALAIPLAGLQNAFGAKGFTIGAMVMMFLGNPLAGIAGSAAWLPSGLGAFGQILPPGAAGTLVRSAAYFSGSGGLTAALTLTTWVVVGLVLFVTGMRRAAVSSGEAVEVAS